MGIAYFLLALMRAPQRFLATDSDTLTNLLLMFMGGGLAGGVFIGLVRSFADGLGGMITAASVLLAPVGIHVALKEYGPVSGWGWEAWVVAAGYTAFMGYVAGLFVWHARRSAEKALS